MFGPDAFSTQAYAEILVEAQKQRERRIGRKPWDDDAVELPPSRARVALDGALRAFAAIVSHPLAALRGAFHPRTAPRSGQLGGGAPLGA